ncbi:hypothetical protein D3C87_1953380 [compost metagenome]
MAKVVFGEKIPLSNISCQALPQHFLVPRRRYAKTGRFFSFEIGALDLLAFPQIAIDSQ